MIIICVTGKAKITSMWPIQWTTFYRTPPTFIPKFSINGTGSKESPNFPKDYSNGTGSKESPNFPKDYSIK
jgi:hypothetical protein